MVERFAGRSVTQEERVKRERWRGAVLGLKTAKALK